MELWGDRLEVSVGGSSLAGERQTTQAGGEGSAWSAGVGAEWFRSGAIRDPSEQSLRLGRGRVSANIPRWAVHRKGA